MSKELTKEEIEKLYLRIECKKENPEKWGWYNTDKGKLFWYDLENSWSCNDERLSEEYPKYWYKEYSDQNTKPLIEKISSLEASLLDVTRKSCARVDELKDEIADLKSQLLISEQKVKLNYNCAIESSKSEANEAVESQDVIWDSLIDMLMRSNSNSPKQDIQLLKQQFTITRNNK